MIKNNKTIPGEENPSVIVGRNPVLELLKGEREIEKLYVQRGEREGSITKIFSEAKARSIPIIETDRRKLDELSGGNAHQGVAAFVSVKEYSSIEEIIKYAEEKNEKPLVVVCDGIEDPHNLGALIRCAECAGAHGIVIPKRRSAVIGQTVAKASAGALEHMMIAKVSNIASSVEELKKAGLWIYGAEAGGEDCFRTDFDCPCAIVLGSEGEGISRLVKEKCDYIVSIPMLGKINSLNVSTAGAVMLFRAVQSRREKNARI